MSSETWLRVVIYRADNPNDHDCLNYMKNSTAGTLAMLEGQPGFRLGYWGMDPDEGTMAAVTYWSSESAIENAGAELEKLRADRAEHGISVESVQNVQLFAVPAIAMWAADSEDEQAPKHRKLFGRR